MIILVGPVGSGAGDLAAELQGRGLTVADSDSFLEQREGMTGGDVAIFKGPEAYADAERVASLEALDSGADVVVLGSGALGKTTDDEKGAVVRDRIDAEVAEGAIKVFLTAEAKVLMNRAGLDLPRSVAIGSPRSTYLTQLKAREPIYEAGATKIDTTEGDWAALADTVMSLTKKG